jgi:DNA repair exonuclease SbcCD ATPase subunit
MADDLYERIVNDERPIGVRRKRRSSIGPNIEARPNTQPAVSRPHGISTPPATPKRTKKRVRFSDPGLEIIDTESASSGLTPFIRRTSISTTPTSKRRHPTPATVWNRAEYDASPISGILQFAPLRQVLDGRVKRRLKRNRLSEEINTIEWDKRKEAREKRSEVERLRNELAAKDLEVQSMRDERDVASQIEGESGGSFATNTTLSAKVQELEQEIVQLKAELQRRESDTEDDPNWTMAARDPFDFNDDDDNMITNYDDDFTMNDEMVTTPTRLNTSFPSPPSTMPNTPCKSVSSINAGIQASLPISDPENEALKSQLQSLHSEISKLTASIAFNDDNQTRLAQKLSDFIPSNESHDHSTLDSALDAVLTQLALSQSHGLEHSTAFSALSKEITNLGFPSSSGPEQTLESIASQFRQARLDLEYLTPGENPEGFENDKLLEMLVSRIKLLVQKVNDRDASIDQYHEQEVLLRQQIDTRVTVMDEMRKELSLANTVVSDLRTEISEKEVSNERLKEALEGYRSEVSGLEKLIQRIEGEGRNNITSLNQQLGSTQAEHDALKADNESKSTLLSELQTRLESALNSTLEFEAQLTSLTASHSTTVAEKESTISNLQSQLQIREKEHGGALTLRDARVSELREEIERVNTSLKNAHGDILNLRRENKELVAQIESTIKTMQDAIARAPQTGDGYINDDVSVLGLSSGRGEGRRGSLIEGGPIQVSEPGLGVVKEAPRMMDGALARRRSWSGKKRRRYDSGLGFLEEEDEGVIGSEL